MPKFPALYIYQSCSDLRRIILYVSKTVTFLIRKNEATNHSRFARTNQSMEMETIFRSRNWKARRFREIWIKWSIVPLKKTGLVGRIILFILCIIDLLQGFSIMVSVMRGGHAMPVLLVKYCETSTFPTRATLTRLRKSSEVLTSLVTLIWAQLILFSPGCWTVGSLSTKHYIWLSNL